MIKTKAEMFSHGMIAGMALNCLNLSRTPVSDFSALKGMPLRELYLAESRFKETDVLAGGTEKASHGTVVQASRDGIDVATGEGLLRVKRLQPAGKRAMSAAEFGNARDLGGAVFGA